MPNGVEELLEESLYEVGVDVLMVLNRLGRTDESSDPTFRLLPIRSNELYFEAELLEVAAVAEL